MLILQANNNAIDLLKFALDSGMIDISTIQSQVNNMKREQALKMHKYEVWYAEKDTNWKTHLPDEQKGRRLIKRKTKEALEDAIVAYYTGEEDKLKRKKPTLRSLFPDWIKWKVARTDSSSYIKRITADWQKYYDKDEISDISLVDMDNLFLDTWAHNLIKTNQMTKKNYYNATVIIRQVFDYAVDKNIVETNAFRAFKVNTKLFVRQKKEKSETQVFLDDEKPKIIQDMIRRYLNNPKSTAPLAVILDFEIGVRIGELVAIKTTDIVGDYLSIQRQEVREYEKLDDFNMKFSGFKVVEHPKSSDGYREIYLTDTAKYLIQLIQDINVMNGEYFEDYLFVENGKRICHYNIERRILRGCEAIGIECKTMHKIRKTYISTLIDSGLNIDEIRRLAGHADERTTYANYCFNTKTPEETRNRIETSLNTVKSQDLKAFLPVMMGREPKVTRGNQKLRVIS